MCSLRLKRGEEHIVANPQPKTPDGRWRNEGPRAPRAPAKDQRRPRARTRPPAKELDIRCKGGAVRAWGRRGAGRERTAATCATGRTPMPWGRRWPTKERDRPRILPRLRMRRGRACRLGCPDAQQPVCGTSGLSKLPVSALHPGAGRVSRVARYGCPNSIKASKRPPVASDISACCGASRERPSASGVAASRRGSFPHWRRSLSSTATKQA